MRRLTTLASILTGALFLAAMPQVHAAKSTVTASLANGEAIFTQGKGNAPACSSCHGMDGMGIDSMETPRLASQVAEFLVKQLEDFATDRRQGQGGGVVMNIFAKELSADDRRDVAAYLSTIGRDRATSATGSSNLEELKSMGVPVGEPHLGLRLINYGAPERDIPACRSCHDFNGRGVEPIYPMLSEQKYVYLVNQLKYWREGTRNNDPREQMQKVARNMTDEDIHNAAAYLTGASPYPAGSIRIPDRHVTFTIVK
ncbi:MAG: c-type cytochrome [Gammaproteobacteria bacterium]|jgi:cytochrome c553|nr:c-type cytochrome [Gammaproteobacteria bacterium]